MEMTQSKIFNLSLAVLFVTLPIIVSCADNPDLPNRVGMTSGGTKRSSNAKVPKITKVEGSKLVLLDLSAIKKSVKPNQYAVSVSFSPPPMSRHIELTACSTETKECVSESTPFTRIDLVGLPSGTLEITARACVELDYSADGVECGPSRSIRHNNPKLD